MTRRAVMLAQTDRLPKEYRRVEYLESTGLQIIDTGHYYLTDDTIAIEFSPLEINVDKALFGIYQDRSKRAEVGFVSNRIRFDVQYTTDEPFTVNNRYKAVKSAGLWSLNGESISTVPINGDCTQHTLGLFCRWYNSGFDKRSKARVYTYSHTRNGQTIQNLIPCVRKSDNKPGMYDTVTKTFYTNAGSGEFIVPE